MNRAIAFIDKSNFLNNWQVIKTNSNENKIVLVVKANAYGHGYANFLQLIKNLDVHALAVACIDEAKELRNLGYDKEIYLFDGGAWMLCADMLIQHKLIPMIGNLSEVSYLANYLAKNNYSSYFKIHLKIDTGFIRNGITYNEVASFIEIYKNSQKLTLEGVCTHFHSADDNEESIKEQREKFNHALFLLEQADIKASYIHTDNSAAFLRNNNQSLYPHYSVISRIGLAAYGYNNVEKLKDRYPIKPIMSIKAKIIAHKKLNIQEGLGYNHSFIAQRPTDVAVVSIGYADGVKRALSNKGYMLFNAKKVPIIGRISMDFLTLDITDAINKNELVVGKMVTVLGQDGDLKIDADDMALWADTISHEILTSFSTRIQRVLR